MLFSLPAAKTHCWPLFSLSIRTAKFFSVTLLSNQLTPPCSAHSSYWWMALFSCFAKRGSMGLFCQQVRVNPRKLMVTITDKYSIHGVHVGYSYVIWLGSMCLEERSTYNRMLDTYVICSQFQHCTFSYTTLSTWHSQSGCWRVLKQVSNSFQM